MGPEKETRVAENGMKYEGVGWRGRCEVRDKFTVQDVEAARAQFPDIYVRAHPLHVIGPAVARSWPLLK